jgi:hypothetical protein
MVCSLVSPLILFLIALLFVIPITYARGKARRRTEAMKRAAAELGLILLPKGDGEVLKDLATYHLFSQGEQRRIANMLWGKADGLEIKIFDYDYSIGSEESRETPTQTVIYFRSPELDLPAFSLRPKSVFHRIATFFGYQDIVFATRPAFSKAYLLRGKDEAAVRKLFDDTVVSHFERGTSLVAEGGGTQFVLLRPGKVVEPEQVRFFVQEGFEVLELFWRTSSRRGQELPDDLRHRFGVRVAGDVGAVPQRHPTGIRKLPQ